MISNKHLIERFWKEVDIKGPDDCWPWKRFIGKENYGRFIGIKAPRFAWECSIGSIPFRKFVLHKCDNPLCCNPRHLYIGDRLDNARDVILKEERMEKIKEGVEEYDLYMENIHRQVSSKEYDFCGI